MQGVAWSSQRHAYDARVAGTSVRCERYEDLLPPPGTALHHWATPAMVLLDQGAHPRHLLLIGDGCATWSAGGGIHIYQRRMGTEVVGSLELPAPAPRLDP